MKRGLATSEAVKPAAAVNLTSYRYRPGEPDLRLCRHANDRRHFSLIGGAIFSAGAGGSAVGAPDFWASASGRAGSGAGVVGRVPPGLDSAGALLSAPFVAAAGFLAYIDMRTRKEGWDIQLRFMALAEAEAKNRRIAS